MTLKKIFLLFLLFFIFGFLAIFFSGCNSLQEPSIEQSPSLSKVNCLNSTGRILQTPPLTEEFFHYFFSTKNPFFIGIWGAWSLILLSFAYYLGRKKQLIWPKILEKKKSLLIETSSSERSMENIEMALRYRIAFEKQITNISTNFIHLSFEKIDLEILRALQLIGEFMEVDRSYIFLFLEQGTKMENTHEWCVEEKLSQMSRLKGLSVNTFPYFIASMQRFEIFHVPDVNNLPPEAHVEKTEFTVQKIQSLICIPMVRNQALIGFLGFDSVYQLREWSEEDIILLKILSEIFANALERKKKEEQLKRSLREKEVLLKEVHHRVKNNLQIISSLLNLQAGSIHDPQTLEVFKESQNRVKSMALIHERLYQSENFAQIYFTPYVEKLVSDLCYSYQCQTILTQIDIAPICLEMDIAIPCGLIINELVSNAFKYAFPKKEGRLEITLKQEEKSFILKISDNGVGFGENVKTSSPQTLGLQLVSMLVEQLNGVLEIFHQNGTTFLIRF